MKRPLFYTLLTLAFAARLVLIPNPGFEADVSFWKSWGLAVLDVGAVKGLPLTNFNYPTPFAYFLAFMVWIYTWFADPHNFNEFWKNTNLIFLAIAKAFPIMADFGIAAVFLYVGRHAKRLGFPVISQTFWGLSFWELLSVVYLLSPLGLFDGALWGQIDSIGVLLFLIALIFLLERKLALAGVIYMVAMMTKLQNMIYGPIFFLFAWQTYGLPGLITTLLGATASFVGLNAEFILAGNSWRIIASIIGNYDYFPWLSLNAYNPWWIFSGARGMELSDKVMAVGIANAKTVGLFTFSSFYLFATLKQLLASKRPAELLQGFLESLILVNGAFFLFQTQSHDRYAFPLSIFLLLWLPFYLASAKTAELRTRMLQFWTLYSIYTVVYFFNLHNALIVNYPNNGIPLLTALNTPFLTIAASLAQTALFGTFLFSLLRKSAPLQKVATAVVIIFAMLVVIANKPLLFKQPVSITKITPITALAGYGGRQVNMPVNASFGFSKWSPLSVQYVFYKTGIGTHAPAREVYHINRQFRRLTTDFGVDTNGGPQASVVFEVWGDGKRLFQSELVKRFEYPRHAEIDISGVNMLELIVTDAGDGKTDDHADWLNTQLWP